jgi:hypothetical protein
VELAGRVIAEPGDDRSRVRQMIEIAYARPAQAEEITAHLDFLAQAERSLASSEPSAEARRREAWNILAQVIVAANEFIYLN